MIPVVFVNQSEADRSFARHRALVKAEADDPSLGLEPWFVEQRETAYAAFLKAFRRPHD